MYYWDRNRAQSHKIDPVCEDDEISMVKKWRKNEMIIHCWWNEPELSLLYICDGQLHPWTWHNCITWKKRLNEALSTLSWSVGMPVGNCLKLIDVGRLSQLWALAFPRQEVPEMYEWKQWVEQRQASEQWMHSPLTLILALVQCHDQHILVYIKN